MHLYAEAFLQWQEATANVREHGAIVAHPRTGSPIENPYLAVQSAALRNLQRFPKLKTDSLWRQEGEARP
jgi:phage terminase small subunit